MPRAGSTLLCNILAQNPDFHATATSGVLEVLVSIRNGWNNVDSFRASPNPEAKSRVMRSVLEAYYADVTKPYVFDKSRGWLAYLEMAEMLLGRPAKVLVPVRDIRDIISSFELIYRKHAGTDALPQEKQNQSAWATLEGRVEVWVASNAPVGSAYNRIKDAITRGFRDRMHFVHFEKLCSNPSAVMNGIYDFLGLPRFPHDFENVEQVTWEDDTEYGFPKESLHNIRRQVRPVEPHWPTVLGKALGDGLAPHNKLWSP